MELTGEIVSGQSIAGFRLGSDIPTVLSDLRGQGVDFTESTFTNSAASFSKFGVEIAKVVFVGDKTDRIVRIWCCAGYQGKYKKTFYPGMSVRQIAEQSVKHLLLHGMLIIDGDYGAGFSIPDSYEGRAFDDVDYISQLPLAMKLDELHVMDPEWWR
jgi:hypothetical protein